MYTALVSVYDALVGVDAALVSVFQRAFYCNQSSHSRRQQQHELLSKDTLISQLSRSMFRILLKNL